MAATRKGKSVANMPAGFLDMGGNYERKENGSRQQRTRNTY